MAISNELRAALARSPRPKGSREPRLEAEPLEGKEIDIGDDPDEWTGTDDSARVPSVSSANTGEPAGLASTADPVRVAPPFNRTLAPCEAPRMLGNVTSREVPTLEVAKRNGTGTGTVTENGQPADSANTLEAPQTLKPSAWWSKFIGPSTRVVSHQDALDCVRLVLTELWGEERAREDPIELEGQVVRLGVLYAELERLTGRAGLWDVVQKLWLAARKREGIQPFTGVPLPPLSTRANRVAFPSFEQGSGLRRELERDGCWTG
jgi:hypothetical protein